MRIIAGKFKGKVLKQFELDTTRPTSDLVKGAIFNILGEKITDSIFLDLFAGAGAVGIEALSRGANKVVFADSNKESIALIKKNLSLIPAKNFIIMQNQCFDVLKSLMYQGEVFDIIFLDPPYATNLAEKCIRVIYNQGLLAENGLIVWEHDETKLELLQNIEQIRTKKYGKKYVSIISYEALGNYINAN